MIYYATSTQNFLILILMLNPMAKTILPPLPLKKQKETPVIPDESNSNKTFYNCDISSLAHAIELTGKQYLSVHRKMLSMKSEHFDMSNVYVVSFQQNDYDKNNYLYSFFIHKLNLTFNMDTLKKFFYLTIKTPEELVEFLNKHTLETYTNFLKEKGIGESFFPNEESFEEMKKQTILFLENTKQTDNYNASLHILYKTIIANLEPIRFHTNNFQEDLVLLKKKSTEKIHNTYSNRFFHLAVYGEDSELFTNPKR